jgi:hypothetical protein
MTDNEKLAEVANKLADLVDEEYERMEHSLEGDVLMDGKVDTPLYKLWREIADHLNKKA